MDSLTCRVCGHGVAKSLGQIPNSEDFAGQRISPPLVGGELWLCNYCRSMFRYPTLSAEEYVSLYMNAPSTVWAANEAERNDFRTIYAYLEKHPGGSILDVGCYTGNFLAGLPSKFEKFGIEPSYGASKIAATRQIAVIGNTLDKLDSNRLFDVVVLIDVVEHVIDVEQLLGQALRHVKGNGLLVISTGNPDCYFWKEVYKSRFWYCAFPEHVTFPSYKYFVEFSRRHGLKISERFCFRYKELGFLTRLFKFLRYIASESFPAFYRALRKFRNTTRGIVMEPISLNINPAGVFSDHHLVIFERRNEQ